MSKYRIFPKPHFDPGTVPHINGSNLDKALASFDVAVANMRCDLAAQIGCCGYSQGSVIPVGVDGNRWELRFSRKKDDA